MKTAMEIVNSLDYNGGINYNKMLPPEAEEWNVKYFTAQEILDAMEEWDKCSIGQKIEQQNKFRKRLGI